MLFRSHGEILLATNGSARSREALAWAVAEADALGCLLRILHVVGWPQFTADPFGAPPVECLAAATVAGELILERAVSHAREIAPGVQLVSQLELDRSASAGIVRAASRDTLIVLGCRRSGRRPISRYKHSTAAQVAGQTSCPVAVIGLLGQAEGPAAGRVAAIVNSRVGSVHALEFAMSAAQRRGIDVIVLLASSTGVVVDSAGAALVVLSDEAPRSIRRALFGRTGRSAGGTALGPVVLVRED